MSAHRARCYGTPAEANTDGTLLVGLTVAFVRSLGLGVATLPPTSDPGHLWIFGKKTVSKKRKLAKQARWVIGPDALGE